MELPRSSHVLCSKPRMASLCFRDFLGLLSRRHGGATGSLLRVRRPLRTTTTMSRKKITGDKLIARAEANGYQRGAHRDEDGLRHRNKHVDKVKRDQDTALNRYVL